MHFTDVIGTSEQGRHPCPFCESSDGLAVGNDGAKGWFHCFSCGEHGDGIHYLRRAEGLSFADACEALGYAPPDEDLARAVRRHKRRAEKINKELDIGQCEPLTARERGRARMSLNEAERWIFREHVRSAHAYAAREMWSASAMRHEMATRVLRVALARELDHHRTIDQLDSHYERPLDEPEPTDADSVD